MNHFSLLMVFSCFTKTLQYPQKRTSDFLVFSRSGMCLLLNRIRMHAHTGDHSSGTQWHFGCCVFLLSRPTKLCCVYGAHFKSKKIITIKTNVSAHTSTRGAHTVRPKQQLNAYVWLCHTLTAIIWFLFAFALVSERVHASPVHIPTELLTLNW